MKYLIAFGIGAATGAIATFLYFKSKINEIVSDTVNEEMEKFLKRQEEMLPKVEGEEVSEENIQEEKEKVDDKPNTADKSSIVKMEETVRTPYRTDNDGIEEDEDDEDDEYITDEEMSKLLEISRQRMSEDPHLITQEEADTTMMGYDLSEYTWYPDSDIITDVYDHNVDEEDILDILFKPINWRKELKGKEKIIVRVPKDATNYVVWNGKWNGNAEE